MTNSKPSPTTDYTPLTSTTQESYGSEDYTTRSTNHHEENDPENQSGRFIASFFQGHTGAIGMLGSISIAVNSLTGPAMLALPCAFQTSGLIPTTLTVIFLCFLSAFCALHMANVISKVPGNANFNKEIEYSEAFRYFWGRGWFVFTEITFFACITCLNIASIVDTAQVVDEIIAGQGLGTFAVEFKWNYANPQHYEHKKHHHHQHHDIQSASSSMIGLPTLRLIRWSSQICTKQQREDGQCIPFETYNEDDSLEDSSTRLLLTLGYVLICLLFLPMSLHDLKDNAFIQIVGFVVLIVLSVLFVLIFLSNGIEFSNVSWWGYDWSNLFGVVLFNFAVVMAIPAWLYEKKKTVCVTEAISYSSIIVFILYLMIGVLGAMCIPNVSANVLQSMMGGAFGSVAQISSTAFAFFVIGLGIPLFSVLTRLNLTGSGLCTEFVGNLLAVYLPWGTSWLLYTGGATTALLGIGGLIFTTIIVFLAPLLLSLHARLEFDDDGSVPVYGGYLKSRKSQVIALYVLLICCVVSIIFALVGIWLTDDDV